YVPVSRFFFQAEDGIRDGHVTGVQTYALPISIIARLRDRGDDGEWLLHRVRARRLGRAALPGGRVHHAPSRGPGGRQRHPRLARSEERRVGKSVDRGGGRMIVKEERDIQGSSV